jgi:hypothetical protein
MPMKFIASTLDIQLVDVARAVGSRTRTVSQGTAEAILDRLRKQSLPPPLDRSAEIARLRDRINTCGMPLDDLARAMGVHPGPLHQFAVGIIKRPRANKLNKLRQYFDQGSAA